MVLSLSIYKCISPLDRQTDILFTQYIFFSIKRSLIELLLTSQKIFFNFQLKAEVSFKLSFFHQKEVDSIQVSLIHHQKYHI